MLFLNLVSKHEIEKGILVLVLLYKIERKKDFPVLVLKNETTIHNSQWKNIYHLIKKDQEFVSPALFLKNFTSVFGRHISLE